MTEESIDEFRYKNDESDKSLNGLKNPPSAFKLDSILSNENNKSYDDYESSFENFDDLSLKCNNLNKSPSNLTEHSSNLLKINLTNNNLEIIEPSFKCLRNLQQLILDHNRLKELPNFIPDLNNLKLISVNGNKIQELPESVGLAFNLEEIHASDNKIENVADSLANLDNLRIFKLSCNRLRSVPNCFYRGLERLEILDLSQNFISQFHDPLHGKNLRTLHLDRNSKNHQFPSWLFDEKLSKFEELILDETHFTTFDVGEESPVSTLKRLSVNQCGVSDLVLEKISASLVNLEYLNVGNETPIKEGNVFWVMPVKGFKNPEKLEEINIRGAGLPALPDTINSFKNLTRLNVSCNNISSLPDEFCELYKLEVVNAASNNLYALPQTIGNLKALRILALDSNRLSSLPDSVGRLKSLEYLDLYNNEFAGLPEQLKYISNLKSFDIDGNAFRPDDSKIANLDYIEARNNLRSASAALLQRSNDHRNFHSTEDESRYDYFYRKDDYDRDSEENKSLKDPSLSDIDSVENWDLSDDSADEFDPTVKSIHRLDHSPFTISSFLCYGNFCPADIHSPQVKDQLVAMKRDKQISAGVVEGQFDDA